jgi:hypothetical protein
MQRRFTEFVPFLGAECWKGNCGTLRHESLSTKADLADAEGVATFFAALSGPGPVLDPGGCRIDLFLYQIHRPRRRSKRYLTMPSYSAISPILTNQVAWPLYCLRHIL